MNNTDVPEIPLEFLPLIAQGYLPSLDEDSGAWLLGDEPPDEEASPEGIADTDNFQVSPEFQREASAVLASSYFYELPTSDDPHAQIELSEKRLDEKWDLLRAIVACKTYEDLQGEDKSVYDRAKATLKGAQPTSEKQQQQQQQQQPDANLEERLGALDEMEAKPAETAQEPNLEDRLGALEEAEKHQQAKAGS